MRLSHFLLSILDTSKWQQMFKYLFGITLCRNGAEGCLSMLFCGKMKDGLASIFCSGFVPTLKILASCVIVATGAIIKAMEIVIKTTVITTITTTSNTNNVFLF